MLAHDIHFDAVHNLQYEELACSACSPAVRLDEDSQRVTHVLWGQVSVSGEQFEVAPHESPVIEVVDALAEGDTVVTVFPLDGHRVAGPEVRRVVYEAGRGGISTIARSPVPPDRLRTCRGLTPGRRVTAHVTESRP